MGQLLTHFALGLLTARTIVGPLTLGPLGVHVPQGIIPSQRDFRPVKSLVCKLGLLYPVNTFGLLLARKEKGPRQNWHLFRPARGPRTISIYTALSSFWPVKSLLRAVVSVGHIIWDPLNIILTSPIKAHFDYTRLFVSMASKKYLACGPPFQRYSKFKNYPLYTIASKKHTLHNKKSKA